MKCPYCGKSDDRVLDTRVQKDGSIRRRRECLGCRARYSTTETILMDYPMVVKKDGRREAFSKEKILTGLTKACQKRPVSQSQIEGVVERIAAWTIQRGESEIPAQALGRKVMSELRQLDDVAYVRFASVYRTFKDVQEFVVSLEDEDWAESADPVDPQLRLKPLSQ